jgi:hypothetical protein
LKVVVKDISRIPVFREDARKVFEVIQTCEGEEVVVDFKGVEVGLSFAKEFRRYSPALTSGSRL